MTKVFLKYDSAKDNYKIVVFVGSEQVVLDGDDVRVPAKFRRYNEPIEPKVDDDWFGATLPSGEEIDINLFREEGEPIYASVYPVDEDGHIDTAHPLMSLDKVSYITKMYYSGWVGMQYVIAKEQSHVEDDGNLYDGGYTLYAKEASDLILGIEGSPLGKIETSYTVEDLVERFIFREV